MGTKMVASFANIFMSAVETEIISLSNTKPLQWKTYIDDIFSLWIVEKKEIEELIVLANGQHPTIKFTAEIWDKDLKARLRARGYPHNLIEKLISEVKFNERKSSLEQKENVRTYHPALPTIAKRNIQIASPYLIKKENPWGV